jgi:malate/lactate dehydrogenase
VLVICFGDPRIRQSGGVSRILPLGKVTEFEKKLISAALPELTANIEKVFSSPILS